MRRYAATPDRAARAAATNRSPYGASLVASTAVRVGFIGLGAMGLPMARHLVEAGHTVTVASRGRGPIDAAVAFGAVEGDGPAAVVAASEVTILCVPNSPQVVEALDAAIGELGPGRIVFDTSTIHPEVQPAQHAPVPGTAAGRLLPPPS